jgi:hypothetical protein
MEWFLSMVALAALGPVAAQQVRQAELAAQAEAWPR